MEDQNYLTPKEIAESAIQTAVKKAKTSKISLLLLGFLAGVFIAFASEGSNMAAFNLLASPSTYGLGKVLAGAVFGTGLMLVLIAGGELFTGNNLMILAALEKKITFQSMLSNWLIVYIGNFIGSLFIAYMMNRSGLFSSGMDDLGAISIKIAVNKVELGFFQALFLGVMCNWLVCLAVWMAYGAKDMIGKIFTTFFPIWLFVTSGFEHSVANMYYIPAGIMAKNDSDFYEAAINLGVSKIQLNSLNWKEFFINNLFPVTIGNIIGGTLLVGIVYWFVYIKTLKK